MTSLKILFITLTLMISFSTFGYTNAIDFENESSQLKALVFLSAFCPCSQSHVDHLNDLQKAYGHFKIYGVITDEFNPNTKAKIHEYYTEGKFGFSIIKDEDQNLVKKYNALKTPHVVLLKKQEEDGTYKIVYEGGVTDQRQFDRSKKRFLHENLVAYKSGTALPYSKGQSLGCYIRRF